MPNYYYLTGWVRVEADSEQEADQKFEAAGLGPEENIADDVTLGFEGPWSDIDKIIEPECICPADLLARGGFRGGCPTHA